MTLNQSLMSAAFLLFASSFCQCQAANPVEPAPTCREGSHERRMQCTEAVYDRCLSQEYAERWYVCQKGEWVQE